LAIGILCPVQEVDAPAPPPDDLLDPCQQPRVNLDRRRPHVVQQQRQISQRPRLGVFSPQQQRPEVLDLGDSFELPL
jgi:hypothetical protein